MAQVRQIDNLMAIIKANEDGRRGLEVALAAIADTRASNAQERTLGVTAPATRVTRPAVDSRRPLTPWLQGQLAGGHLDHERFRQKQMLAEETEVPGEVEEPPKEAPIREV